MAAFRRVGSDDSTSSRRSGGGGQREPPAFLRKMQADKDQRQVAFPIPSVMQLNAYVDLLESFTKRAATVHKAYLAQQEAAKRRPDSVARPSGGRDGQQLVNYPRIAADIRPLLHQGLLKEELARRGLFKHTGFEMPNPLVPFRVARDLILDRVSSATDRQFLKERGIVYVERDKFGNADVIKGLVGVPARRTPVACITGHIDHGKTTLLDRLQQSAIAATEAGGITQSIRAFTIGVTAVNYPTEFTIIDTPGHKVFAEMRMSTNHVADVVILIVALDEGVQPQTEEVIAHAKQFGKPIVVALNKVDRFVTDPAALAHAVHSVAESLARSGIAVQLVDTFERLQAIATDAAGFTKFVDGRARVVASADFDPAHAKHSRRKGAKKRKRSAAGDIASPAQAENSGVVDNGTPTSAGDESPSPSEPNGDGATSGASAATALKPNEKAMHHALAVCMSGRDGINVDLLVHTLRQIVQARPPVCSMTHPPVQARVLEATRVGENAAVSCLVRNGVLRRGMPFVCDTAHGVVTHIQDPFGGSMAEATAGRVCHVFGFVGRGGATPGKHLIAVESKQEAERIAGFRHMLHRYLEHFHTHAHLLRPEGMDTSFLHIGNHGQIKNPENMYGHNLLFGQTTPTEPATDPVVEQAWLAVQTPPDQQPRTEEEAREQFMKKTPFVVFLKVDSYHSARLFMRELPRLGTKDVAFLVVSISFGTITEAEVTHAPRLDIVISYRAPKLQDSKAGYALDRRRIKYFEFSVYSDVINFFKKFAVEKQADVTRGLDPRRDASISIAEELLAARGIGAKKGAGRTAQQLKPVIQPMED